MEQVSAGRYTASGYHRVALRKEGGRGKQEKKNVKRLRESTLLRQPEGNPLCWQKKGEKRKRGILQIKIYVRLRIHLLGTKGGWSHSGSPGSGTGGGALG